MCGYSHQLRLISFLNLKLIMKPYNSAKVYEQFQIFISGSKIIAMALNTSETVLIALTDTLQLMSFALKSNKGKSRAMLYERKRMGNVPFWYTYRL